MCLPQGSGTGGATPQVWNKYLVLNWYFTKTQTTTKCLPFINTLNGIQIGWRFGPVVRPVSQLIAIDYEFSLHLQSGETGLLKYTMTEMDYSWILFVLHLFFEPAVTKVIVELCLPVTVGQKAQLRRHAGSKKETRCIWHQLCTELPCDTYRVFFTGHMDICRYISPTSFYKNVTSVYKMHTVKQKNMQYSACMSKEYLD